MSLKKGSVLLAGSGTTTLDGHMKCQSGRLGNVKQNDNLLNATTMNMISKFGSHSSGTTASTKKATKNLSGNEVEFSAYHLQEDIEDGCKENEGRGDANIRKMQKTGESDESYKQSSSIKEISLKYSNRTAGVVLGHKSHGLSESNEKHKTFIQKVAPTDKLWDGYLQLNSSVTISAVAFFKSGEKMPNVKWSESVEVKGKVKIDAFEKYIEDLRRSRNRGLMVVSLRWKEGSSKLGLAGMKKVVKRYEEGERVGLARLLSGIDLYVCPRNETIITILARHGFFKGRTAIEENENSLIGCVVWRRNQINLNSVQRKSDISTYQVAPSNISPTHLPSESLESSGKNHTALDVTKQKDRIEKDRNLSVSPQQLHNSVTGCNVLTRQSTPSILPMLSAGTETSYPDPENQQVPLGQSLKLKFHVNKSGGLQDQNFKPPRPVLVLPPPNVAKQPLRIIDSEDLPEFDFGTSGGLIPQVITNRSLDSQSVGKKFSHEGFRHMDGSLPLTMSVGKKFSHEGFRHMDGSLPLTMPTQKSCPTLHKRRLENLSHRDILSDGNTQRMPQQKKVCRHDNISQLPLVVDRQSRAAKNPYSTLAAPPAKSRFNDDDMPEWCPPDVNLVTNQSPNIPIHSMEPNLIPSVQATAAQNLFSSACVVAEHPPFSTLKPHFAFNGPVFGGEHAQPRPTDLHMGKVLTSSRDINRNEPFGSSSCLVGGKPPINHEAWKGWMS